MSTAAIIAVIIVGWALCGFLAYGLTLAHYQRKYILIANESRDTDRRFALATAFFGPISLFVSILMYRKHGFMWRLPPRREL